MRFVWAFILLAGFFLSSCRGKTTPLAPPPPAPTHFTATEISVNQVQLSWQSGGGSTDRFVVSYRQGFFPPLNCNDGTILSSSTIGSSLAVVVHSLPRGFYYSFRLCAEDAYGKRSAGTLLLVDWVNEPTPPALMSVSPLLGPQSGGTEITLTGSDFSPDAIIKVAGNDCLSKVWDSDTQMRCILPPSSSSGDVSIRLENPNGTFTELSGFTYVAPPPEAFNIQATVIDSTQIKLEWQSGEGSTAAFQVAYSVNQSAPSSCTEGTVIDSSELGLNTETTLSNLEAVGNYQIRVCAKDEIGGFSNGTVVSAFMGWTLEAYLKAPNTEGMDFFGTSVSLSGDTLVVGASGEDGVNNTLSNSGAAYVYRHSQVGWILEAYVKAPNAGSTDAFGISVGASGDRIVVGAHFEDNSHTTITNGSVITETVMSSDSGAAYVFVRKSSGWVPEAYLRAPNQGIQDQFGGAVAISGDRIVVGAIRESSSETTITNGSIITETGVIPNSGAAYVFKRESGIWKAEAYLKAPNPGELDLFGNAVSISGDTLAVGAYQEDNGQTTITNGSIISEPEIKSNSGAVYIFRNQDSLWVQEAYIKAPNSGGGDFLGYSISLSSDTLITGAYQEDSNQSTITNSDTIVENNSLTNSGAAYVFRRVSDEWRFESYLKASNRGASDFFGFSVASFGDLAVAGSTQEDNAQNTITHGTTIAETSSFSDAGAAYVFKRGEAGWTQEAYLKAPNLDPNDRFGNAVAGSLNHIAVGAQAEGNAQTTITDGDIISESAQALQSGAVYVFKREKTLSNPRIQRVFPTQGEAEGQTLFVFGSGFQEGAMTSVGSVACDKTFVVSSTEIQCVLPPIMDVEAVSVQVTHPDLSSDTLEGAYTYPVN